MANENTAIVERVRGTALEAYGDRDVVRELTYRVMKFHPVFIKGKIHKDEAKKVALQIAQLSILMGASPLPGLNEIHVYDDGRVEPGINYWQRQAEEAGGVAWRIKPRPMNEHERERYDVADGQYGAICEGLPRDDFVQWLERGLDYDQIFNTFATVGVGVAGRTERAKNGRPGSWTAIKRAKTDFYKNAFPFIPGKATPGAGLQAEEGGKFTINEHDPQWGALDADFEPDEWNANADPDADVDEINDDLFGKSNGTAEVVEGEWSEAEEEAEEDPEPEPAKSEKLSLPDRPWSALDTQLAVQAKVVRLVESGEFTADQAPTEKRLAWCRSSLAAITTGKPERYTITQYLVGKRSTSILTAAEVEAICKWIDYRPRDDEGEDWQPNPDAIQEAANIIRSWQIEQGQQSLFGEEEE